MRYFSLVLLIVFTLPSIKAQDLNGKALLDKAIKYHDPNGNWSSFIGQLNITMSSPKTSNRNSIIRIDLPNQYFSVKAKRDTTETAYILDKGNCSISLNGTSALSKAELFANDLSCERANMYKNYYTFLYGLPMKLKDDGTIVHEQVERKSFKGKNYLVLKVSYEASVGNDIWYFYFNPKSFAMEVYQFYKTDKTGHEIPNSGEYIVLSDEVVINDIKMPKVRAWYYNKDDGYLGTDTLK